MTCIQVPWLQQIASGGNKSPRPPVYESLDWTAPNVLWWNIALGKKPQVEIVTAFSSIVLKKSENSENYTNKDNLSTLVTQRSRTKRGLWILFGE